MLPTHRAENRYLPPTIVVVGIDFLLLNFFFRLLLLDLLSVLCVLVMVMIMVDLMVRVMRLILIGLGRRRAGIGIEVKIGQLRRGELLLRLLSGLLGLVLMVLVWRGGRLLAVGAGGRRHGGGMAVGWRNRLWFRHGCGAGEMDWNGSGVECFWIELACHLKKVVTAVRCRVRETLETPRSLRRPWW